MMEEGFGFCEMTTTQRDLLRSCDLEMTPHGTVNLTEWPALVDFLQQQTRDSRVISTWRHSHDEKSKNSKHDDLPYRQYDTFPCVDDLLVISTTYLKQASVIHQQIKYHV